MRNRVPGVIIPDEIVERLAKTPKEKQAEEGKRICIEMIEQVRGGTPVLGTCAGLILMGIPRLYERPDVVVKLVPHDAAASRYSIHELRGLTNARVQDLFVAHSNDNDRPLSLVPSQLLAQSRQKAIHQVLCVCQS